METDSKFLKKHLFENFEQVFGKDKDIIVALSAQDGTAAPNITISEIGSSISAEDVSIRILNPYSSPEEAYEAAVIRGRATADLVFELEIGDETTTAASEYKLVIRLENASLEVTDLKTYFWTELTVEDLLLKQG